MGRKLRCGKNNGDRRQSGDISLLRWTPAALLVVCFCFRGIIAQWELITSGILRISVLSVLGVILFPTTLYKGLQTTTSLNAALYLSVVPLFVLILNFLFYREKLTLRIGLGSGIAFWGVLWLLAKGNPAVLINLSFNEGDLWAIASAFSWACYCSLARLKPQGLKTGAFLGASLTIGVLLLTPIWLLELQMTGQSIKALSTLTVENWVGISYLAIGPSALSYWFWNRGLDVLGSARGSMFNHLIPLSSAGLGMLFLNEQFYIYHLVSVTLIVAGILISSLRTTRKLD